MSKIFDAIKKSHPADGLAITMSRYDTKCSREQVLGLRPDLRKVDKHLCNKGLKFFLNEHFDYYCLVSFWKINGNFANSTYTRNLRSEYKG